MTQSITLQGLDGTTRDRVERTIASLQARGIQTIFVRDRIEALAKVLELIPKGSSVAHGGSTTLAFERGCPPKRITSSAACRRSPRRAR